MAAALILCFALSWFFPSLSWAEELPDLEPRTWQSDFREAVSQLDKNFEGTFGIYVQDHATQETFSYHADQPWYLASVVKVFVLVEIVRLVDLGRLSWTDQVTIRKENYRDGPGPVNWIRSGSRVSIRRLVEAMVQNSDNAATDILINVAGLTQIRASVRHLGVYDLGPLTAMLDVRRLVYQEIHPLAGSLSAKDFIRLWKEKSFPKKLEIFSELIGKPKDTYVSSDLEEAFADFYAKSYNTASLVTMGRFFQKLVQGTVWSKSRSQEIVELMKGCKTGKKRIRPALPAGWVFAHKTGTQHRRSCDFGLLFGPKEEKLTYGICAENFNSRRQADEQYGKITKAFLRAYTRKEAEPEAPNEDPVPGY